MKTLAMTILATGMMSSAVSMACMPPPPGMPAITIQGRNLDNMINSEVVHNAVIEQGLHVRMKNINFESGLRVTLSNGCAFTVTRNTSGASPGTCPELLPIKLVNQVGCE